MSTKTDNNREGGNPLLHLADNEDCAAASVIFTVDGADFRKEVKRPGLPPEIMNAAEISWVSHAEAYVKCGLEEAGIWIPYFGIDGAPLEVGGRRYGRLRLDSPRGDMKYFQPPNSGVHAYLPPSDLLKDDGAASDLFLTEGEFKALALIDAGYLAVGLPGFFAYTSDEGRHVLLPELKCFLDRMRPPRIFFVGDSDTALNHYFSIAAVTLAELVSPIPVLLPRLPLGGPKGVDDLKEALA